MKLRVHRRHESGASNADQRLRNERSHRLNASDIISRRQANNSFHGTSTNSMMNKDVEKLNQTTFMNQELYSVLAKSKPLYEEGNKEIKQRTAISFPRTSQLEEKLKQKRVFVGDSLSHLDNVKTKNDFKINKDDSTFMISSQIYGSNKKEYNDEHMSKVQLFQTGSPLKNKLLQEVKHEGNKQAKLETQLVEIRDNVESTEGKFNLNKINEIKAAIQRKYHHRNNFKNIFQAWDEEGKGVVNSKNITNMLKRMGIKCNLEEAQILLSTADKDHSNDLNMQEFLDLIFVDSLSQSNKAKEFRSLSEHTKLSNIQLYESLPNLNDQKTRFQDYHEETSSPELQKKYRKHIQSEDEARSEKRLKFVLKNKITQLLNNFWITDYKQTGKINQKILQDIIRRKVDLSANIISDQEINTIFQKYSLPSTTDAFDYKSFIKDLKSFNYSEKEQNTSQVLNESMQQTATYKNLLKKFSKENPSEFNLKEIYVNDIQSDNPSHIDWMKSRADKLSKHIQKFFANQNEFSKYLKEQTEEAQSKNQIHKKDLLTTFKNMFDQTDLKFEKRDYEGIMEMFQYNKHGYTSVDDIPKIIYEEDARSMYTRISQKIRGPPPLCKQNNMKSNADQQEGINSQSVFASSNVFNPEQNDYENRRNDNHELQKQSATVNVISDTRKNHNQQLVSKNQIQQLNYSTFQENDYQAPGKIKNVLKKVEDRLFLGDTNSYQLFKTFDLDKDGYVKKDELNHKLSQMSILNQEEQKIFNKYVDPGNQGYLNFSQFNQKINSQMSTQFERNEYDPTPYTQKQIVQNRINMSKTYNSFIENTRQQFQQSRNRITSVQSSSNNGQNSRSPDNNNNNNSSFNNVIKPLSNTSMYQNEQDRFSSNKLDFQQQDKQKKDYYNYNKLQNIRINNNIIEQRRQLQQISQESKMATSIQSRAATKLVYEHIVKNNILAPVI